MKEHIVLNLGETQHVVLRESVSLHEWLGMKKLETDFSSITLVKPRHIVCIQDEKLLDKKYLNITYTINKKMIEDDLKNGVEVEGAYLRAGEEGLSVRLK